MANPALKNGYISVATELVEVFARKPIPSSEMRLVWVVWRKTWGWKEGNRKRDWDWVSLSQFAKATEMKRSNVAVSLKSLVCKRILLKEENRYKFNQNYEEWVVVKRIPPVCKRITGGMQTHDKSGMQTHTHKRKKETITKEIAEQSSAPEVFSLQEEITKLEESTRRDLNIVALYLEHRKPNIINREQYRTTLSRHLRPAKALVPFTDNQLLKALDHAKREYKDIYTLETLIKILTK